jgi:4-aminobutyrate aminotransferase-like enzyme
MNGIGHRVDEGGRRGVAREGAHAGDAPPLHHRVEGAPVCGMRHDLDHDPALPNRRRMAQSGRAGKGPEEATRMTPPRNSNAARDVANVLHPYTDHRAHEQNGPMVITRGKGVRVWDDQGREYIEAVAGLWCASLGFDNERLVRAATEQMAKLPFYHAFTAKSHEPMIDLSEMLIERAPPAADGKPMSKVFFANSGSEANDSAIKMVWYVNNALGRPNKKKIISRLKAYHGITIASAR